MSAGFNYALNTTAMNQVDIYNSTYMQHWLFNMSTTGDLNIFNLARDIISPQLAVFGWLFFPIIYLTYIAVVWISGGDLILSLIMALITMGIVGIIFPAQVLQIIATAIVVAVTVVLLRGIQKER